MPFVFSPVTLWEELIVTHKKEKKDHNFLFMVQIKSQMHFIEIKGC